MNKARAYGAERMTAVFKLLAWENNVVSGYTLYLRAYFDLAHGKHYTEPASTDPLIKDLIEAGIIKRANWAPHQERLHSLANAYGKLKDPVDYCYEVIVDIYKLQPGTFNRVQAGAKPHE